MMTTEILGALLIFLASVALAWPLGAYLSRVFRGERTPLDFLAPLERGLLRLSGLDGDTDLDWRGNVRALLVLNGVFFVLAFGLLLGQGLHPFWNPNGFAGWEPTLAFNTAVSFVTNTNLQHYSGESGASYFTQLLVFCWLQFVSAATGIAACALLFRALATRQSALIGNFYGLFVKSCTRVLLPLAFVTSLALTATGVITDFDGIRTITTLEGAEQQVAGGPGAPMIAIKQIGTNGGGFFGPNSTHPFENADYAANVVSNVAILLVPIALVFAFGFYLRRRRLGLVFAGVMTVLFVAFVAVAAQQEVSGNAAFDAGGLAVDQPNLEGKELRFGPVASALWAASTTSTSNGSVNSMHDSHTPLAGGVYLLDMMINAIYGGVGVGFINFFVFVILAVFIAGQMIGRTPDFLGKKIESREVKIAAFVAILHPLLILGGTALSVAVLAADPALGWLNNAGFHGFSEILYENTSAAANNGSGFEGLGDNTPFWNLLTGVIMLLGRFLPIVGPLAIAGSLAAKQAVPATAGSLRPDSAAFAAVLLSVIVIVAALSFFPVLALGPLAELFS